MRGAPGQSNMPSISRTLAFLAALAACAAWAIPDGAPRRAEITASRLLVCDFHGNVVAGEGVPEATAFYIHARVHKNVPRARAAFHTHMPNATALAMVAAKG